VPIYHGNAQTSQTASLANSRCVVECDGRIVNFVVRGVLLINCWAFQAWRHRTASQAAACKSGIASRPPLPLPAPGVHSAISHEVQSLQDAASSLERKLSSFMPLTSREMACLAALQSAPVRIRAGQELVHEGQSGHKAYILQRGWACSYKLLADGGRQIINFPLPGDFLGLRSVLLRTSDHSFAALTDIVVSSVEGSRMMQVFNDNPRLAAAILWAASRDEAMIVEHLVNIGRRTAIERTAHFFLELRDRLRLVGLATDKGFACPLNQYVLADALGLSAIHINRMLRQLRERRLLVLKGRRVVIGDLEALKTLAGFQSQ
jgi:CRP-like cAMP-binding protein